MKLTALGEFVNRHGVLTPPQWWRDVYRAVDSLNDQDPDLGFQALDEMIDGLTELRERWYEIVNNVASRSEGADANGDDQPRDIGPESSGRDAQR